MAMVTANCWKSRPVMPGMKTVGRNTAARTSAMAMTGPATCSIAARVASRGAIPSSMWRSTASTTTMASSTTRPMATTIPIRAIGLMENPRRGKKAKVPMSETGTATAGISVARHPCRKTNTTMITRTIAINSVSTISRIPSVTERVVSSATA